MRGANVYAQFSAAIRILQHQVGSMSVGAMQAVFEAETLSSTEKLVLLALADYAGTDGVCFPSYKAVETKTALSRRTIISTVGGLEKRGILKRRARQRQDGSHASNEITINLAALRADAASPGVQEEDFSGERAAPLEPRTNQEDRTNGRESARLPGLDVPKPDRFEEAWKAFPNFGRQRSSKLKARPQWDKMKAKAGGEDALLLAVQRFSGSPDALKEGGAFVKAFDLWLRDGRWEYWLDNSPAPTRPTGEADWF